MAEHYDHQLEKILVAIIRDYRLPLLPDGWQEPGDLPQPPRVMAETILAQHGIVTLLADKSGHSQESLLKALRQCARLYGQLYDFLVLHLFSTQTGRTISINYYQTETFLVMVFQAPVAPVMEAIGRFVMPFVRRYHRLPPPDDVPLNRMAHQCLDFMFADDHPLITEGIIRCVRPMFEMSLRPLPGIEPNSDVPAPRPLPRTPGADEDETQPASPEPPPARPAESQARRGIRHTGPLRAPVPYWDISDKEE